MFTPLEINKDYKIEKIGKDLRTYCGIDIETIANPSIFSFLKETDLHDFTLYTSKLVMQEGIENPHHTKMYCKKGKIFQVILHLKFVQDRFIGYIEWSPQEKRQQHKKTMNKSSRLHWRVVEKK
jgi:light-regulated signal transduction histidine kinase (bacteriophytochrome)